MQPERSQELRLRNARPEEAGALTALALRSKRSWGYDEAFMKRVLAEMIVTPELIETSETLVVEEGRRIVGYARIRVEGVSGTLHDVFVEPDALGRGVGRTLCDAALRLARAAGAVTIELESDPNAEAFYLHLGARRIGEVPSSTGHGRMLPVLVFDL
ncbi:MAG: GNAT family N-acetyltransferase [Vulcanimicrobiaceae bacterium]